MERRIEILFPVLSPALIFRLKEILSVTLQDNVKAREQNSNGEYHYVEKESREPTVQSQLLFFEWASRFIEEDEE